MGENVLKGFGTRYIVQHCPLSNGMCMIDIIRINGSRTVMGFLLVPSSALAGQMMIIENGNDRNPKNCEHSESEHWVAAKKLLTPTTTKSTET